MTRLPARTALAVALVDPAPDDVLLEAGCGPGVAAALLCDRLTTGRLLAVDRSATALARAAQRGAEHVAAGRLVLQQAALADAVVADGSVDTAFAVDVNAFWTGPADRELTVLQRALRDGGRLHLVFSTPADRVVPAVREALLRNGFADLAVVQEDGATAVSATCRRA